ncbi:MAG: SDR family oxidoreductase [Planctomycetes bacterium]|nr:SDR family oxidoreductase [Planctomycetota bacterium]MCL4731608.1 SDR family oxidoreductase [Planctomycetota bacterium]
MAAHEPFDFSGRVAWVTGAGRGIGLAVAKLLALHGARVAGVDITTNPAMQACCARVLELDVSGYAGVEQAAQTLAAEGLVPDILVNNAGIARDGVLWKLTESDWNQVLDVNLKGAFNFLRHAVPLMRATGRGGSIVNISSINGLRGKFGQTSYSASKAGMIGLTKAAARELGRDRIRVNAVAPGMVMTDMTQRVPLEARMAALQESLLGTIAHPEDVANAVLFLASPMASHITGQVLQVDGGQYL